MSYEKEVLEKWFRQIQSDEIHPEILGFPANKQLALEQIRQQINRMSSLSK